MSRPPLMSLPDARYRVATSPGWHPYLRRLDADVAFDQLRRPPVGAPGGGSPRDWVGGLPPDTELVHVLTTGPMGDEEAIADFAAATRDRRLPVVLTVFELNDRDRVDPGARNTRLELLVELADEVTTLTHAAARRVEQRWGTRPRVIGHPHVAPLSLIERRSHAAPPEVDRRASGVVVGLPLSAAARSAPWEAATAMADLLARRPDCTLEVMVADTAALDWLEQHPVLRHRRTRVVHGSRLDDGGLLDWLQTVDVVLLPYRHATHSAWARLCEDLSLRLVSVADDSMLELGLTSSYAPGPLGLVDVDEVARAVEAAIDAVPRAATADARRADLQSICSAHRTVYGRAVARTAS